MKHGGPHRTRSQAHTSIRSFQNVFCVVRRQELGMELFKRVLQNNISPSATIAKAIEKRPRTRIFCKTNFAALPIFSAPKRRGGMSRPPPPFSLLPLPSAAYASEALWAAGASYPLSLKFRGPLYLILKMTEFLIIIL